MSTIRTDVIETQNQGQTTAQDQTDKNPQFEDTSFQDAEMDLTSKSITSTKDETEEDIDDTELMKIKDFLEESVSLVYFLGLHIQRCPSMCTTTCV